ncbi:MAG: helix-turn-helix transcriptional regulator [Oscillospiraceae bacterium]|jgi:transcriptional regulator with XRE-family HTH domain|nr:helix-turn-helix transcriptional regulator [Oscillospiraceae bacterium]
MSSNCENHYKTSRKNAGLTQEHASELLGIAPRTLCGYENGEAKVPEDIVSKMADVYNCPLLAWWHLKKYSPLGKYLPHVQMPKTNSDMAFQLWQAQKTLTPTVEIIMEILSGDICSDKSADLITKMGKVEQVRSLLVSAILYSKTITGAERN